MRIPLLLALAGCLFVPFGRRYTTALVIMAIACVTDYLDGALARRLNAVSDFGKLFDSLCDKVLTIGVFITFLALDFYPPIFLFPVLAVLSREFLVTGMRMMATSQGLVLAAERSGKVKTALQMLSMNLTLLSKAFPEVFPTIGPTVPRLLQWIGYGSFLASSFIAVSSGMTYFNSYRTILCSSSSTTTSATTPNAPHAQKPSSQTLRSKPSSASPSSVITEHSSVQKPLVLPADISMSEERSIGRPVGSPPPPPPPPPPSFITNRMGDGSPNTSM
ncbi:CDP-diacylglycerol-glycerol-3-phosphate 3-phosphatidyltransferase [Giardia muris]|uniref:CDP-diacylglycerol-glycerol-3-phosphate 3-phosphatidyltransferase n=1 Tax=Giardia muris TaxID=5742 RepID=A0A4Z1T2P7_GIAMU|nr:CDP-diacylglycerol-glycerol-3-phosphate 3-phosphatidyltransferase [Giardia muris]|eukprot:TNJ28223.1 CDP-diacylglycerol-glycerol-3-phosphate 3-phosphatidyltransferase [Giardia muris]